MVKPDFDSADQGTSQLYDAQTTKLSGGPSAQREDRPLERVVGRHWFSLSVLRCACMPKPPREP